MVLFKWHLYSEHSLNQILQDIFFIHCLFCLPFSMHQCVYYFASFIPSLVCGLVRAPYLGMLMLIPAL